ncbi:endocytosis defective- protein [Mycoemilia scoparia]|uniref:Endocytosis defective- protein n=1 Tax=Mycoemilia scoparia TaxID=417184 RepID=A0A9W7ZY91_9FUNG|nr:endocytosis defective- protein [Mycoemilia scoparia]
MDLVISNEDYQKYKQYFEMAAPANGKLSDQNAKNFLLKSQLPVHYLGQIWELSDMDRDGQLDLEEFCIAMKLVYSLLENKINGVPNVLPPTLVPQTKKHLIQGSVGSMSGANEQSGAGGGYLSPQVARSPSAALSDVGSAGASSMNWFVPSNDRANYEQIFRQMTGGGTSSTVKMLPLDEYLHSFGLPWNEIVHVWNMIDVRKYQELNKEQFVYFLHVINSCIKGARVPDNLPPAIRDKIYKALDLNSDSALGVSGSINYTRRTGKPGITDSRKPGLYGEKSGNVALADSYLSKLRNASTFESKAGSRYASSRVNEEERSRLQKELDKLDNELKDINIEISQVEQQQQSSYNHLDHPDSSDIQTTLRELEEFLEYKQTKKEKINQLISNPNSPAVAKTFSGGGSIAEIKQDIYDLQSHYSFLQGQTDALKSFIQNGRDELVRIQLETIDVDKS